MTRPLHVIPPLKNNTLDDDAYQNIDIETNNFILSLHYNYYQIHDS